MKRTIVSLLLLLTMLVPTAVYASDIDEATFYGVIRVSNNSTAATEVATVFTCNTTPLMLNDYINSEATDTAIRTTAGADIAYMPGYAGNEWCLWVPSIGENSNFNDILYTGGTTNMSAKIRYFPDTTGMTVTDNASLEPGDNFTMTWDGYFDTELADYDDHNFINKEEALTVYVYESENISAGIFGWTSPTATNDVAGGAVSWNNEANAIDGDTGTAADSDAFGSSPAWSDYLETSHAAITTDRIRYWVNRGNTNISKIDLDAYYSGAWHDVFENTPTWGAWQTKELGSVEEVSNVRIRFYCTDHTGNPKVYIYEVDYGQIDQVEAFISGVESGEHEGYIEANDYFFGLGVDKSADTDFPASDNLVLNLPLFHADMTGATLTSKDANEHSCTVTGATWSSDGRVFDGNDVIVVPNDATLQVTGNITLAAWVNGTTFAGDFRTIAGKGNGANYYFRTRNTGATYFAVRQGGVEKSSPEVVLSLDTWYMVTGVYDGAHVYLYVNTTQYEGVAATGAIDSSAVDLEIGRRVGGSDDWWIGTIAEVRLYNNTAFSQTDVATQYNATSWKYDGSDEYFHYDYLGTNSVPDTANDWLFFENDVMPYVASVNMTIDGAGMFDFEWEYGAVFNDTLGNGFIATPSFRTTSSDADVSATLASFIPIEEAQAPAYSLSTIPDFITSTPGMTGDFANVIAPTYPGRGVIHAIAIAAAVPERLATTLIFTFILLVISLGVSAMMRGVGSGALIIKFGVICCVMGIYAGLKIYEVWQVYFFVILAIGIMWMSRQREAY